MQVKRQITFLPDNITVNVDDNTNLFRAVKAAGVYVLSSCGGKGNCGKCKVVIKEGDVEIGKSQSYLTSEEIGRGYVLACHSHIESDLVVIIPPESRMQAKHKIATGAKSEEIRQLMKAAGGCLDSRMIRIYLDITPPTIDDNIADYERLRRALDNAGFDAVHLQMSYQVLSKLAHVLRDGNWKVTVSCFNVGAVLEVLDIYPGEVTRQRYGAAIDIGTTTVVVYLVEMRRQRYRHSFDVQQSIEVRRRRNYTYRLRLGTNGLKELQDLVLGNIDTMLAELQQETAFPRG